MILSLIIQIAIDIISWIYTNITPFGSMVEFHNAIQTFLQIISGTLQNSFNFLYLCFGQSTYLIATMAIYLLLYKYTVFPIAVIARRLIIKGGDE